MRRAAGSMNLRPAATYTSDSPLEQVDRSGLSMETGMKHRAESCRAWLAGMAVVAIGLIIAPSLAATQGSGGRSTEPVASPQTNVTTEMLQQAQQSGDWLMY